MKRQRQTNIKQKNVGQTNIRQKTDIKKTDIEQTNIEKTNIEKTNIANNNGMKKFRIVELDIIREPDGTTFKTLIDAKDAKNAMEIFYTRFPDAGPHILVVPEEYVVDHRGFVAQKEIVKVQKKMPLIKLIK